MLLLLYYLNIIYYLLNTIISNNNKRYYYCALTLMLFRKREFRGKEDKRKVVQIEIPTPKSNNLGMYTSFFIIHSLCAKIEINVVYIKEYIYQVKIVSIVCNTLHVYTETYNLLINVYGSLYQCFSHTLLRLSEANEVPIDCHLWFASTTFKQL